MNWFDVDKDGLAKLIAGRSKAFVLYELLQNAWDQVTTEVTVTITPIKGKALTKIVVEDDDPEGFSNLAHAYTLFAESAKKGDVGKRGRFNLGEKLVLALAKEATIETTKGTVYFDSKGRHKGRACLTMGSRVTLHLPLTRLEHEELLSVAFSVIVPDGIRTTINGSAIVRRKCVAEFSVSLPTVVSDDDGVMKPTVRRTLVRVYEPAVCERTMLYEMGIPVVETGDKYHVDIQQKVPLNMDRDNVTPAYLRAVRVAVLNATFGKLDEGEAARPWVREACSDERVHDEAASRALTLRFGAGAVAYDPMDTEANKIAVSEGRQVVYGGHLSGDEWVIAKRVGSLKPAGLVTPSPKPFSPDGEQLTLLPRCDWTEEMRCFADFARWAAMQLLNVKINVEIAKDFGWPYAGAYGPGRPLIVNMMRVGRNFFNEIGKDQLDFLIHEFGHHYSSDHLSAEYHGALTDLGARLTMLALRHPALFKV